MSFPSSIAAAREETAAARGLGLWPLRQVWLEITRPSFPLLLSWGGGVFFPLDTKASLTAFLAEQREQLMRQLLPLITPTAFHSLHCYTNYHFH